MSVYMKLGDIKIYFSDDEEEKDVSEQVKKLLRIRHNKEIADILGIGERTLSSWKFSGRMPKKSLMSLGDMAIHIAKKNVELAELVVKSAFKRNDELRLKYPGLSRDPSKRYSTAHDPVVEFEEGE